MTFQIRPFVIDDQTVVRQLILDGLGEHFGFIDESLNPDLDDIQAMYIDRGYLFVVAVMDDSLVGTGGLIEESDNAGRLMRMSVAATYRGRGLAKALVGHLLAAARERGYDRVVCETNHDWHDAIGLYLACGFRETGLRDGDRHFEIALK